VTIRTITTYTKKGRQMLAGDFLLQEEIEGEPLVFLPHLRKAEEGIALTIRRLAEGQPLYSPVDFEKAVAWCQERTGKTLAPSQREALKTVLLKPVVVITGGPGVSKTTLEKALLKELEPKLVAPAEAKANQQRQK
jgi:exodeoxyribonuclease V alpha subunit